MPDLFDDLNKILKKDLVPILVKYFKDPNNKISDNLNDILNDPQSLLTDIFDMLARNKDDNNNQSSYTEVENIIDIDGSCDDEYDDLLSRLTKIEDYMNQIEKILKNKN